MRMPTSRVRRLTENDITAYRPTDARKSATKPKIMNIVPNTRTNHSDCATASSSDCTQYSGMSGLSDATASRTPCVIASGGPAVRAEM